MAITEANLMQHSQDWDWVDQYAKKMGDARLVDYSRKLFSFLHNLPDDSEILIDTYVKKESEDLFAKCVGRFIYEGTLNLCFSADLTRLRKLELKPKQSKN